MGAFDGTGRFVRSYNWQQDATNGIDITASRMDTEDDGFAAGLGNCVTRDGQGRMAANFTPTVDMTYECGTAPLRWKTFNGAPPTFFLHQTVFRSADLGRSSNSLMIDPDLVISNLPVGHWVFEMLLNVWGTTTSSQGILLQPVVSTTGFVDQMFSVLMAGAGETGNPIRSSTGGGGTHILADVGALASTTAIMSIQGRYRCNAISSLSLWWSTRSVTGNNTNIGIGSYLKLHQVG